MADMLVIIIQGQEIPRRWQEKWNRERKKEVLRRGCTILLEDIQDIFHPNLQSTELLLLVWNTMHLAEVACIHGGAGLEVMNLITFISFLYKHCIQIGC